ncbi:unnamed protein product, partial [Prorocentrum cordatum]
DLKAISQAQIQRVLALMPVITAEDAEAHQDFKQPPPPEDRAAQSAYRKEANAKVASLAALADAATRAGQCPQETIMRVAVVRHCIGRLKPLDQQLSTAKDSEAKAVNEIEALHTIVADLEQEQQDEKAALEEAKDVDMGSRSRCREAFAAVAIVLCRAACCGSWEGDRQRVWHPDAASGLSAADSGSATVARAAIGASACTTPCYGRGAPGSFFDWCFGIVDTNGMVRGMAPNGTGTHGRHWAQANHHRAAEVQTYTSQITVSPTMPAAQSSQPSQPASHPEMQRRLTAAGSQAATASAAAVAVPVDEEWQELGPTQMWGMAQQQQQQQQHQVDDVAVQKETPYREAMEATQPFEPEEMEIVPALHSKILTERQPLTTGETPPRKYHRQEGEEGDV